MDGGWMAHESCIKRRFLILFLHKRLFDQTSLSLFLSLSLLEKANRRVVNHLIKFIQRGEVIHEPRKSS